MALYLTSRFSTRDWSPVAAIATAAAAAAAAADDDDDDR